MITVMVPFKVIEEVGCVPRPGRYRPPTQFADGLRLLLVAFAVAKPRPYNRCGVLLTISSVSGVGTGFSLGFSGTKVAKAGKHG